MDSGARGFTLIELLVVLVIIGTLVALTTLSTGIAGPGRELRNEAERLSGLIGVLADEAVLDNREYGVRLERDRYQVMRFDERSGRWTPLGEQAHRLPEWAEMHFELDGEALILPTPEGEEQGKGKGKGKASDVPQLLILSSGEFTPFRLQLSERRADGVRLALSSDGFRLPKVESGAGRG
ncbi:type II secretion system minor pseudopilin GspH [Pseudomonas sp. RIT-PI-AD]|uniref:type II secretion system minor pseudopilin GspH n=1 Tax=Pseudomonas sp. RIT-PI-AD TaxID=3035294 RepID=UPI0021D85CF0|nr:type II secretion system minor pseudopilin GspH [Pseudomonas sp. RIT-PI-AD]